MTVSLRICVVRCVLRHIHIHSAQGYVNYSNKTYKYNILLVTSSTDMNTDAPDMYMVVNGKVKIPRNLLPKKPRGTKRRKSVRTSSRVYYGCFLQFAHYTFRNDLNKYNIIRNYFNRHYENIVYARRNRTEDAVQILLSIRTLYASYIKTKVMMAQVSL